MTKITIIAATQAEIEPIMSCFSDKFTYTISGIGSTNTAIATIQAIEEHKPNLILQIGIAGAIDHTLKIGQAVIVARDYVADLGAFRGNDFEQFESTTSQYPYIVSGFDSVSARTVNAACSRFVKDDSQIETMEGAAFMMAAKSRSVRFMQLRTISNYTNDPRSSWHIQEAIDALPLAIGKLLNIQMDSKNQ